VDTVRVLSPNTVEGTLALSSTAEAGSCKRTKWAAGAGETGEVDVEVHALAALNTLSYDRAADGGLLVVGQRRCVDAVTGIVANDGGIA